MRIAQTLSPCTDHKLKCRSRYREYGPIEYLLRLYFLQTLSPLVPVLKRGLHRKQGDNDVLFSTQGFAH